MSKSKVRPRRGASLPKNLSACRPPAAPAQQRATLRQFNAQDRPAGAATLRDAAPQPV